MPFGEGENHMGSDRDDSEKRGFLCGSARRIAQLMDHRMMLAFAAFLLLAVPSIVLIDYAHVGTSGSGDRTARILSGTAPEFAAVPPSPYRVIWNATVTFQFYLYDADNDNLNVTWDWGDGSPIELTYTDPAGSYPLAEKSHVYAPYVPGATELTYLLNVSADDGNGNNVTSTTTIILQMPTTLSPTAPEVSFPTDKVAPGDLVIYYTNSSDPEGDALTWTYVFNDSVSDYLTQVYYTLQSDPGALVWNNATVVFDAPGNYTLTIYVSDAAHPYQVYPHNVSRGGIGPIQVAINQKPTAADSITVNPGTPIISYTLGYVAVNFSLDASDPDGDVLTATWDFDDGTPLETDSSMGGIRIYAFNQTRNFTTSGSYNVSVTVTDGIAGHEVVVRHLLNVTSPNRPPSVARFNFTYATLDYALQNETVEFTLVIFDPERDPISITVDFGDNSSKFYRNLTEFVDFNVTVVFSHKFIEIGNYTVDLWYTDNMIGVFNHSKRYNVTVTVKVPIIIQPVTWSWWDYTSLGLFCMIPVAVAVQYVMMTRRRKAIENEGMTVEEWKLRRSQGLDKELERELELQKRVGP